MNKHDGAHIARTFSENGEIFPSNFGIGYAQEISEIKKFSKIPNFTHLKYVRSVKLYLLACGGLIQFNAYRVGVNRVSVFHSTKFECTFLFWKANFNLKLGHRWPIPSAGRTFTLKFME